jgi:F-type H+-transporting ATPase subunit a
MTFGEKLVEELQNKTAFVLPVFGGIPIPNSIFITWIIMAIVIILSICLTRNLKVKPTSRIQLILEYMIGGMRNFFDNMLGEKGKRYTPWLMTVATYLVCANLSGLFGVTPPTKDINVTAALAVMSIVLVIYAGIREKKLSGYGKSFFKPVAFIAPINVLELFLRPVTLCMRLFGNMFGGFVVMELLKLILPVILPIPFSMYFDIFDGLIQAYVFVLLTSLYVHEAIE